MLESLLPNRGDEVYALGGRPNAENTRAFAAETSLEERASLGMRRWLAWGAVAAVPGLLVLCVGLLMREDSALLRMLLAAGLASLSGYAGFALGRGRAVGPGNA